MLQLQRPIINILKTNVLKETPVGPRIKLQNVKKNCLKCVQNFTDNKGSRENFLHNFQKAHNPNLMCTKVVCETRSNVLLS